MDFEQKAELVDALLSCETMKNRNGRDSVADNLSDDIRDNIQTGNNARTDVLNIVSISEEYRDGITKLISVLRFHEGRSRGMEKVDEVMRSIYGAEEKSDYENIGASQPEGRKTGVKTENLDTKILEILYNYFRQHPGEPRMMYNELVRSAKAESADVIQCLYGLREKKWTDFDLTVEGETGLVWLTPLGIRIAKDTSQKFEGESEGVKKADDVKPVEDRHGKPQSLDKRALRKAMSRIFTMEDLELLCADIEHEIGTDGTVNLEMVGGSSKEVKILKLIEYLEHRKYLNYLVDAVREARPGII